MHDQPATAAISIDMDNLWAYLRTRGDSNWQAFPSFFEVAIDRIKTFFVEHDLKPTAFFVGQDLEFEHGQHAVTELANLGLEIGNHSYSHRYDMHLASRVDFTEEIQRTGNLINNLTRQQPQGFRGPSFQLNSLMKKTLVEQGYRYDASCFPSSMGPLARFYHTRSAALSAKQKHEQNALFGSINSAFTTMRPYRWSDGKQTLYEIPLSTLPLFRFPIHFTYINFLADISPLVARGYFKSAIRLLAVTKTQPSFLLHVADFLGADDENAPRFLPGMKRTSSEKIQSLSSLIKYGQQHFAMAGLDLHLDVLEEQYGSNWIEKNIA